MSENANTTIETPIPRSNVVIWPGKPYPLGATYDGEGVNFALFSENADKVELCLFDPNDPTKETHRIELKEQTDLVWHAYLPGIQPGQHYGYRVHGEWNPEAGLLFNPNKVLIDPYAKAIDGVIDWHPGVFGYPIDDPDDDRFLRLEPTDSAPYVNKSVVVDNQYDWEGDLLPEHPMHRTVIYECHVKGFTINHPNIPLEIRGKYAALGHPEIIHYFKHLGVTAVELMPIHHFIHDKHLVDRGLRNYWGYNTLGFFAPHSEYASSGSRGEQIREFRDMVKALHKEGIEVILDVVYNHTGEGNHYGPLLSFRGIDNPSYYRLVEGRRQFYTDYTGTGNTLNMLHPRTLQMVMDSLRYWVTEMHVDGFRFDLASALARGLFEVGKLSTFLDTIHQDPIVSQVKLIAEPWDVGPGGYQVGNFPVLWSEWNGKYRDNVRSFWKGNEAEIGELGYRLSGSSDLYEYSGRLPSASINFITSHDGFTLRDLVSYNEKHNEANGEDNRDGDDHNQSWNCGIEGPTRDPKINALRAKQQRNFLATLLFSQGVPMISMGDEYGRTQEGNNNPYCQDNTISYFNWNWTREQRKLYEFVRQVIQLRKVNPIFHRRRFFSGRAIQGADIGDILWINPEGREMTTDEWNNGHTRCLGMLLNGEAMDETDERGQRIKNDIFLVLINSYWEEIKFMLPGVGDLTRWQVIVDTTTSQVPVGKTRRANRKYLLKGRSLVMLRLKPRRANIVDGRRRISILEQLRQVFSDTN